MIVDFYLFHLFYQQKLFLSKNSPMRKLLKIEQKEKNILLVCLYVTKDGRGLQWKVETSQIPNLTKTKHFSSKNFSSIASYSHPRGRKKSQSFLEPERFSFHSEIPSRNRTRRKWKRAEHPRRRFKFIHGKSLRWGRFVEDVNCHVTRLAIAQY